MRKMVWTVAVSCFLSAQAKTPTVALQVPERVYAGETFTAKLVYQSQNSEHKLPAPIFEVVSTGQVFHVSGNTYTNRAWILGLSTNAATPGYLEPEEAGEVSFSVTAGDRPIAWNVILHEAGQGGDSDAFPLGRLFSPRRLAETDAVPEMPKDNVGETWKKFYEKFGDYLTGDYPIVYADFWKTAATFAEMRYFISDASGSHPALTSAEPAVSGRSLRTASCSRSHGSSKDISDATGESYDGTLWLYCPVCKKWKLCLQGAFQDEDELKIYETLDWSQPVYVITLDSASKLHKEKSVTVYESLASALLGKGTVLGASWTYGGSRNNPAKSVDHSADTVARHLELLGANPTKITFIGTGYGAHVAANAIALYESDSGDGRSFARLVAIDPLTTDYGILSESAQASSNLYLRAAAKCSQIDLYRASWSRSLTHADQLFGDYNFALWPEGGFRADTLGNEWDRSDAALAWFTSTVTNSTDYADLGFNFDGGNAWHALTGATEPPPAGTFAGVIDGHYLELADYVSNRGADVAARYAATMRMTGSATNVMENLFGHLAGTIDYAVADDASLDASGKSVTFTVSNVADNVAIPYDALSIFSPKPFYPWRRGVSLGVWLVDLTALSAKVSAAELESADGAGLAAILRANGGEAFARRVGELWVDDPSRFVTPLDSESFSVPVRVRSDCFGAGRTIGETTLLLAAGVMSGSEGLPSVYEGDLDTANNFARLNATPVVVPFFAEVSINGQNVVTGAVMEVSANADGSWTASLAGGQTEDTNGNAIHYDFHVAPETAGCEVAVTSAGATGATLTGALASGLVEGRYTVTVTARNGTVADDDALAFTLVVTREVTAVGESKDTYATVQDGPLTAYIRMLDEETPEVTWQTNIVGRTYTVKGKATLADEEWVAPTNSTHRFFRVFADPVSVTPRTP